MLGTVAVFALGAGLVQGPAGLGGHGGIRDIRVFTMCDRLSWTPPHAQELQTLDPGAIVRYTADALRREGVEVEVNCEGVRDALMLLNVDVLERVPPDGMFVLLRLQVLRPVPVKGGWEATANTWEYWRVFKTTGGEFQRHFDDALDEAARQIGVNYRPSPDRDPDE